MNNADIALAALLHDVGKFMQRAFPPGDGLGEHSRRLTETLCPSYRGRSSHVHVLYTNEFVMSMPFWPHGVSPNDVANLACAHHRPDTPEQEIIARADRLSSGMEREEDSEAASARRFRRTRLRSVASQIDCGEQDAARTGVMPLSPLSPEQAFPKSDTEATDDLTEEYRALWEAFLQTWRRNRCPRADGFINRALSVLERYTWCIPSATNVVPDISLFDHSITTAAIAVCLFDAGVDCERPFRLVAGDLTGIQPYIFGIYPGAGGLAKRLRARSFKVTAFAEAISLGILSRLDLSLAHRILFAGGKFHLLLPDTERTRSIVGEVREEAARWLFEESSGELGLCLAERTAGSADLRNFSRTVAELQHALREEKSRPARALLCGAEGWDEQGFVLPAMSVTSAAEVCRSCRQRAAARNEEGEGAPVCETCYADGRRGQRLPGARYVAFRRDRDAPSPAPVGSFDIAPGPDGVRSDVHLVADLDGVGEGPDHLPLVGTLRARHVPTHADGDTKTFEGLAAASQNRLGYLKMDLDDLGFVLSRGLKGAGADRTSISRTAALSRTLDLFFSGHVEWLLREKFPDMYLIYSGGDDLLAVGPWHRAFELALRIREDFRRFTSGNPTWTLSAGVAVVHPHASVLAATEEADKLLEASKKAVGEGVLLWPPGTAKPGEPRKDRITAFGVSMPWPAFGRALERAGDLVRWLENGALATSQVRRLLGYAELYRNFQRTGDTRYFRYAPHLVYDLKRNWQEKTPEQRKAKEWAAALATPESEDMKILHFLCQYALCAARTNQEEAAQ